MRKSRATEQKAGAAGITLAGQCTFPGTEGAGVMLESASRENQKIQAIAGRMGDLPGKNTSPESG